MAVFSKGDPQLAGLGENLRPQKDTGNFSKHASVFLRLERNHALEADYARLDIREASCREWAGSAVQLNRNN